MAETTELVSGVSLTLYWGGASRGKLASLYAFDRPNLTAEDLRTLARAFLDAADDDGTNEVLKRSEH